jgi:hypothetical protein
LRAKISHSETQKSTAPRCIQRNPTKGIESRIATTPASNRRILCCIQRNPTKGIESFLFPSFEFFRLDFVAFKEIPQRELRVLGVPFYSPLSGYQAVAFKEIPQRELREASNITDK